MKYSLLIQPEPKGGFSISIPALPGCHSRGETLEEAIANIHKAAEQVRRERAAQAWASILARLEERPINSRGEKFTRDQLYERD